MEEFEDDKEDKVDYVVDALRSDSDEFEEEVSKVGEELVQHLEEHAGGVDDKVLEFVQPVEAVLIHEETRLFVDKDTGVDEKEIR